MTAATDGRARRRAMVDLALTGVLHAIPLWIGFALVARGIIDEPHGVVFAWLATVLAWNAARLWTALESAEPLRVELPMPPRFPRRTSVLFAIVLLGFGIRFAIDDGQAGVLEGSLIAVGVLALLMAWRVRPNLIGVGRSGIWFDHHVVPWERIEAARLDDANRLWIYEPALFGLTSRELGPLVVPPALRAEVEEALVPHVGDRAVGLATARPLIPLAT